MPGQSTVLENPARVAIDSDGYALFEHIFTKNDVAGLLDALGDSFESGEDSVRSRSGMPYAARNVLEICPEISQLWRKPFLETLITETLGVDAGLVRALYLNKPPGDSWAVPWHKDVVVPVKPGPAPSTLFSKPTDRAGVPHAEAPLSVLRKMLTLRIHLDDNTDRNGPLNVLPGSHKTGKDLITDGLSPTPVYAAAGDVLALRPLVAHKSGHVRDGEENQRRVLQLQFSASRFLPDGYKWVNFEPV